MSGADTIDEPRNDGGEEPPTRRRRASELYDFVLEPAADIVAGPQEDPDYLVKGLMPASGLHVLYGPPGIGKSFLALDNVEEQSAKRGLRPRLIVLDTLSRSMGGLDESSSKDMGTFVANARRLSKRFDDALVMPVHHTGKDADRGMRGSSALHGAADAMWQVRSDEEGLGFLVEKMKDAASGYTVRFSLRKVACGTDRDGETVTTQVVEFPDDPIRAAPKPTKKPVRGSAEVAVQRVVTNVITASGKTTAEGAPGAVGDGKAVKTRELIKTVAARLMEGGVYKDLPSARAVYSTHSQTFKAAGILVERDGWTWLGGRDKKPQVAVPF